MPKTALDPPKIPVELPAKTQFITIFFASCMMIVIGGAFLNISGLYINSGQKYRACGHISYT